MRINGIDRLKIFVKFVEITACNLIQPRVQYFHFT